MSRVAHQHQFANKTSSYNTINVYKATNYQIYKTGTINKLTCLETYPSQPGGPLKGPADDGKRFYSAGRCVGTRSENRVRVWGKGHGDGTSSADRLADSHVKRLF